MTSRRCDAGWSYHLDHTVQSRHYTCLGEGLGGQPLAPALQTMLADMMHICDRNGVSWDEIARASEHQFAAERQRLEARKSRVGAA